MHFRTRYTKPPDHLNCTPPPAAVKRKFALIGTYLSIRISAAPPPCTDLIYTGFVKIRRPVLFAAIAACAALVASETTLFPILKSTVRIGKQETGFYLLPTSQLIHPWGELAAIPGRPVDLTFDSQKRFLAILNTRNVLLHEASTGAPLGEIKTRATSYAGLAFRPGDREVWFSETARNGPDNLVAAELSEQGKPGKTEKVDFAGHPVPAGIGFSPDGALAYVAMSRNNSLAVIDASRKRLVREISVGMAPFGIAVSGKHKLIFVSNRAGRRPSETDVVAPSSGSEVVANPQTGATSTGTVTVVEATTLEVRREILVGLAPSGMALSPDESILAVANGHSDSVSLIDTATLAKTDVKIPSFPDTVLGAQPVAAAFSPAGSTLYVACGGNNAIAVLKRDAGQWKVMGALPAAWFPSGIAVAGDGSLRVVATKGTGNTADKKGSFNSRQYEGSLLRIPAPEASQVTAGTREVRAANSPRFEPSGGVDNLSALGIQHVFFIIKENRTYDQVFGDVAKGNGDPKLCFYGQDITPNHHALAEKYVLLDNFHTGGAISFDGHHWLMQAFVSDYVERAFAASPRGYAWNMSDALTVSPAGFFWQSATRPVDVRIFGEFCLPGRWNPATNAVDMNERGENNWSHYWKLYKEGKWQTEVGCNPGVPALSQLMSLRYPHSSTSIPDQIRVEEFLRELREREKTGKMPQIVVLTLNNDHTNGKAPGSPTPRAMVADNDLALGRMVEGLSKSRFWAKSLILVVEDDAQDGLDHVDGRRTVAMAIGPHIRRGAVDSNFYTHLSMVKTIQDVYRIPPRTRFLAAARAMNSVFTNQADLSPYRALTPKVALDEMNPPLNTLKGRELWAARQSAAMNWKEPDDIPPSVLNRILWWEAKGYGIEYPNLKRAHLLQ